MLTELPYLMPMLAALTITQKALLATVVLGIASGLLGSFVVMRRVALVGDALSHAVLPGVVLGFLISHQLGDERNPWIVFVTALVAGLAGAGVVRMIESTTRIKSDAALGIVLAGFFGIGLAMESGLRDHLGNRSGIDSFIYGQAAMISQADLNAMMISTGFMVVVIVLLMRPFLVMSFDEGFAVSLGYPVRFLNMLFYALLTLTVVVSMQAVGVILVSAMLITPAATAFLLTDRFRRMIVYAMSFSMVAGLIGVTISSKVSVADVPTGATIALTSAILFGFVFFLAPQHGVLAKVLRVVRRRQKVRRENTLKAIYKLLEADDFMRDGVSIKDLAQLRRRPLEQMTEDVKALTRAKVATWQGEESAVYLTPDGWRRAVEIVRNHRLWELYLTNQANYAADHVHEDAEKIEHVIGEDTVRQLERDLDFPELDPHGKPIPSVDSTLVQYGAGGSINQEATGY